MSNDDELPAHALSIQQSYPRLFFACHVAHTRRASTPWRLSESDSGVLAHLDARRGVRPGELAAHLALSPSALSATIARLLRLRCIERVRSSVDRRAAELRLTALGVEALQATSVLDTQRLQAVLARLAPRERAAAAGGLALLARGADELLAEQGSATRWERRERRRESATRGRGMKRSGR